MVREQGPRRGPPLPLAEAVARYAAGWFPMDDEPLERELPWYAVEQRAVFELEADSRAALRRRVARSLRCTAAWELARDRAFEEVLADCARPRHADDGIWITQRLARLYRELHAAGVAHSYELWTPVGRLAAGILAVRLRRAAMLESMAHRIPHAGNALISRALDHLAELEGVVLCDIQLPSDHTVRLGARTIPRAEYEARLQLALETGGGS